MSSLSSREEENESLSWWPSCSVHKFPPAVKADERSDEFSQLSLSLSLNMSDGLGPWLDLAIARIFVYTFENYENICLLVFRQIVSILLFQDLSMLWDGIWTMPLSAHTKRH